MVSGPRGGGRFPDRLDQRERGGVGLDAKTSAITRRKVLKQAGLAAGAAFAAPMLVSTSSAFASTSANVKSAVCTKLALNGSTAGGLGPCDYGDSPARPCPRPPGGFLGAVCDPPGAGPG